MADMFDPSAAESIARNMKKAAEQADRMRGHLFTANSHAQSLQTTMAALVAPTSNVANQARAIAQALGNATNQAKNTTKAMQQTNAAAGAAKTQMQQTTKQTSVWVDMLKVGASAALYNIISTMKTLERAGFGPVQQATNTWLSGARMLEQVMSGYPTSLKDAAEAGTRLSKNLGGMSQFSKTLWDNTIKLNSAYGVSYNSAAKLNALLYRWNDGSDIAVKNTTDWVAGLAKANGVAPGDVMEEMAKNSEVMARYGAQGAKNFGKMAIELSRAGVSIKEMSNFGDKLVNDFEGALTMTAKMQTIMPGFNTSGIMMASQFGTEEDIAKELQAALRGSGLNDLSQLPRSLQNMLTSSLGLTKEGIQNLLHPEKNAKVKPPTVESMNENTDRMVSWLTKIFYAVVTMGVGAMALRALQGKGLGFGGGGGTSVPGVNGAPKSLFGPATGSAAGGGGMWGLAGRGAGNVSNFIKSGGLFKGGAASAIGGAVNAYSTYKETGSAGLAAGSGVGSTVGGTLGMTLGSAAGPIGTIAGGIIGSAIGKFLGVKLAGLFVDTEKLSKRRAEAEQKLIEQTEKMTNLFGQMGGKNMGFAQAALSFLSGNGKTFDANKRTRGGVDMNGRETTGAMGRQGGGGNQYIDDMQFGPKKMMEMLKTSDFVQAPLKLASSIGTGISGLFGNLGSKNFNKPLTANAGQRTSLAGLDFSKPMSINSSILNQKLGPDTVPEESMWSKIKGLGSSALSGVGKLGGWASGKAKSVLSLGKQFGFNFGGKAGGLLSKVSGIGGLLSKGAGGLLKGGLGGLLKGGAGKLLGGVGGKLLAGLGTGGIGTLLTSLPGVSKTIGQVIKNPIGSITGLIKNPGKAVASVFKGIGGLFGKKKKATPTPVAPSLASLVPQDGGLGSILGMLLGGGGGSKVSLGQGITVNTSTLEAKLDQLIAIQNRGNHVYMDGKKVGQSIVNANRYGG